MNAQSSTLPAVPSDAAAGVCGWSAPEDPPTEAELARGLSAGDEACLAAAYRRWSPLVHTLARRSLGDAKEAEDVTQQVFIGVWRGRRGYRPERGTLTGWIVGITRRKIADALIARTRRSDLVASAGARLALTEHTDDLTDAALDQVVVGAELAKLLRPAAGAAPDVLRGSEPDPDRGAHGVATGYGQEPCAARPVQTATRPRSRFRRRNAALIVPQPHERSRGTSHEETQEKSRPERIHEAAYKGSKESGATPRTVGARAPFRPLEGVGALQGADFCSATHKGKIRAHCTEAALTANRTRRGQACRSKETNHGQRLAHQR